MKLIKKEFLIILCLVLFLANLGAPAVAINYYCNSCADCTNKINGAYPGNIIYLTSDITESNGPCINNPANFNNKIFDCQGHKISGNYATRILMENKTGNTVKNCVFTGRNRGIMLSNSSNNTLMNNTANVETNGIGIWLGVSSNNLLMGNTANYNNIDGIYLSQSSDNTLANNYVKYNGDGIHLIDSFNNILTGNQIKNNHYYGIYSENSNSVINSNAVCSNIINFYSFNWLLSSGDNNQCSEPSNWNDAGATGCTYGCSKIPQFLIR